MATKTRADYEREWREGVQGGITRVNSRIDEVIALITRLQTAELSDIKAEIAVLKVKSGIWGLIGGAIPAVAALLYVVLHK